MPVTRQDVVNAFHVMLGRAPDSDSLVQEKMTLSDVSELYQQILNSPEFVKKIFQVGQNAALTQPLVESKADPELMRQILDRISKAWRAYGESEPYWSVLAVEAFDNDRIVENRELFYFTGKQRVEQLIATLHRNGVAINKIKSCLDFGCGVGRLTLALCEHFPHVTGLDISEGHLREARKSAAAKAIGNVAFKAYSDLDEISALERYDLLVTFIVLQHNPPPVIREALLRLLSRLNEGGIAVFQVPTFIENYQFSVKEYLSKEQPQMEMNALPQPDLYSTLREAGCDLLEVREDLQTGGPDIVSQTFTVVKEAPYAARSKFLLGLTKFWGR